MGPLLAAEGQRFGNKLAAPPAREPKGSRGGEAFMAAIAEGWHSANRKKLA
jgi:hypothetical protein